MIFFKGIENKVILSKKENKTITCGLYERKRKRKYYKKEMCVILGVNMCIY